MEQGKFDTQESALIKKMIEDHVFTRHHISYDDDDANKWKRKLDSYAQEPTGNCPHQCPGLPARMRTAQPSSSPDAILHQEARTQVSLEIAQLELPKKIRRLRTE